MKIKSLLFFLINFLLVNISQAQDNLIIPPDPGSIDGMINNDVDGTSNRPNPNRIYILLKDQIYYQNLSIHVTNRTETLTIVDEEGGKKPVIIMQPIKDIEIGQNEVKGEHSS